MKTHHSPVATRKYLGAFFLIVLEAVLAKAKEKLASTEARFAIPESNTEAYFHLTAAGMSSCSG